MSWDGNTFNKYRIGHVDGSPLKGKRYFVLRLDSEDPVEAARVEAAMLAYKGEDKTSASNAAAMRDALESILNLAYEVNDANADGGCRTNIPTEFVIDTIKNALAAPARNCDVYADEAEARRAFLEEKCEHPCGNCTVPKDDCALCHTCGLEWLFATATKGEADGSK